MDSLFGSFDGVFTDIDVGNKTAGSRGDGRMVVGVLLGGTFFGGSNVEFITVEVSNLLVNSSKDPSTVQETSAFQEEAEAKQNVGEGGFHKGNREGRRKKTPHHGPNNGGTEGSNETSLEELLDTVRHTKNVFFVFF